MTFRQMIVRCTASADEARRLCRVVAICAYVVSASASAAQTPVQLEPDNPAYLRYAGRTQALLTSGEHYGAVLNAKFDYRAYLRELRRWELNLTRTFSGTYREAGTFGHGASPMTTGVGPAHFIAPWALSIVPGGIDGRKFDLDRWNPEYFRRLHAFLREAGRQGVIVELVLFSHMYNDVIWRHSPLHPENSLQGAPWASVTHDRFLTLDNPALLERQKAVARKIAQYVNAMPPGAGRLEAWEVMLGGGAVYSNLNHAYQVENPRGRSPASDEFRRYL